MISRRTFVTVLTAVWAVIPQCAKNPSGTADGYESVIPSVPVVNDSTVTVTGLRAWYLERTAVSPAWSTVRCTLSGSGLPDETAVWVGGTYCGTFAASGNTAVSAFDLDSVALEPGTHVLVAGASGSATGFFADTVRYSAPYCITISNDWDLPSWAEQFDANLALSEGLHRDHPALVMTHFVGPYAFTDSAIGEGRMEDMASWLCRMEDEYGDENGLHIHPYCNLVTLAGVFCRLDSPFVNDAFPDGYAMLFGLYDTDETTAIFACADSALTARGLDKPVSFRAGGWAAGPHTLAAAGDAGYLVDASGCNLSRGEEFADSPLGAWLADAWPSITDTSQPYYLPAAGLLEAPDNGLLADYVDSAEMADVFRANWDGGPLASARHASFGYHPITLHNTYGRLDGALSYFDRFLAADDAGPVVYVRMRDLPDVWND